MVHSEEQLSVKRLFATRQELEDLKVKYTNIRRSYDSIAGHAAKESAEYVRLQKIADDYEREIKNLQLLLGRF